MLFTLARPDVLVAFEPGHCRFKLLLIFILCLPMKPGLEAQLGHGDWFPQGPPFRQFYS